MEFSKKYHDIILLYLCNSEQLIRDAISEDVDPGSIIGVVGEDEKMAYEDWELKNK